MARSLRSFGSGLPRAPFLPVPHSHLRYKQVASIGNPGDDAPISSNAQIPSGRCAVLGADVSLLLPVWVAARDIAKGQGISASDLVEKELDVSRIQRGFTPSNHSLLGHKATGI